MPFDDWSKIDDVRPNLLNHRRGDSDTVCFSDHANRLFYTRYNPSSISHGMTIAWRDDQVFEGSHDIQANRLKKWKDVQQQIIHGPSFDA
jgi:hypothetical protein